MIFKTYFLLWLSQCEMVPLILQEERMHPLIYWKELLAGNWHLLPSCIGWILLSLLLMPGAGLLLILALILNAVVLFGLALYIECSRKHQPYRSVPPGIPFVEDALFMTFSLHFIHVMMFALPTFVIAAIICLIVSFVFF